MHELVTFNLEVYQGLAIADKLESVRGATRSIRKTLRPGSDLNKIDVKYLDALRKEISAYFELFDAVVDAFPMQQIDDRDIEFIQAQCEDVSSVHKALREVLKLLLTAREALTIIEEDKKKNRRFDVPFHSDYLQCLQTDCYGALTIILENIQKSN